ncbi:hypothetical protein [Micromonospora sp. LOL_021]|uniref:hypothetical protein n=1 Tax=Micromonospora sp. LOL_021 TaxID=3345417 RepID=UPI003A8C49FB
MSIPPYGLDTTITIRELCSLRLRAAAISASGASTGVPVELAVVLGEVLGEEFGVGTATPHPARAKVSPKVSVVRVPTGDPVSRRVFMKSTNQSLIPTFPEISIIRVAGVFRQRDVVKGRQAAYRGSGNDSEPADKVNDLVRTDRR